MKVRETEIPKPGEETKKDSKKDFEIMVKAQEIVIRLMELSKLEGIKQDTAREIIDRIFDELPPTGSDIWKKIERGRKDSERTQDEG